MRQTPNGAVRPINAGRGHQMAGKRAGVIKTDYLDDWAELRK
jgi:hypothetical protein